MPARFSAIKWVLEHRYGCTVTHANTGSHFIVTRPDWQRPYPVTAHNGLKSQIGDDYIRGLARLLKVSFREMMDVIREC